MRDGNPTAESYLTLAEAVDLNPPPTGTARWKTHDRHRLVGRSTPRLDLPAKVFGGGFIQDLKLSGMIHARVLRQPDPKARLLSFDEAAARRAAGSADLDVLIDGATSRHFEQRVRGGRRACVGARDGAVGKPARAPTRCGRSDRAESAARHRLRHRRERRAIESPSVQRDLFAPVHFTRVAGAVVRHRPLRKRPFACVDPRTRCVPDARQLASDHRYRRRYDRRRTRGGRPAPTATTAPTPPRTMPL